MLTRLIIRNFKLFEEIDIDLDRTVVLIGPNNSGKTTALQALALWRVGLARWIERHGTGELPPSKQRVGVPLNRLDVTACALPAANLLWRRKHTRQKSPGSKGTHNVLIDIEVHGVSAGEAWRCGLEFDYQNAESFVCRALREDPSGKTRMPVPDQALATQIAFLPPMSGMAANEYLKHAGEIEVRIGAGQTAEVLRNLCYKAKEEGHWPALRQHITDHFGITLAEPELILERSELQLSYTDRDGTKLDITSAGRGLQQTLLLLAHLYLNPHAVLLLDEPDAHLEILRQREIYQLLTRVARERHGQIICASHSEVLLEEAAERDRVVAFVGKPHTLEKRPSQVRKSLRDIRWDHYYQAEDQGWILYLEGGTDLAILQAFARLLDHPAARYLNRPFVDYVGNDLARARNHFHGLREACPNLTGVAVFDRIDKAFEPAPGLAQLMWGKREIENYFCRRGVLMAYARGAHAEDLFSLADRDTREAAMNEEIEALEKAYETLGQPEPWSGDAKASEFLDRLFKKYFERIEQPVLMRKGRYYELVALMDAADVAPEVAEKLDAIAETASEAKRLLP